MFMAEAIVYIIVCIYFMSVSKNWVYIQVPNIGLTVLGICFLFMMPETPRFLLAQGKTQEAKEVLGKIAKFNGLSSEITDSIELCLPCQPGL